MSGNLLQATDPIGLDFVEHTDTNNPRPGTSAISGVYTNAAGERVETEAYIGANATRLIEDQAFQAGVGEYIDEQSQIVRDAYNAVKGDQGAINALLRMAWSTFRHVVMGPSFEDGRQLYNVFATAISATMNPDTVQSAYDRGRTIGQMLTAAIGYAISMGISAAFEAVASEATVASGLNRPTLESAPPRPNVRPATQQPTGGNGHGGPTRGSTAAGGRGRPTYVPTEPNGQPLSLPRTPGGQPAPSSLDPHTQIGWRDGRRGGYVQTREFGPNGQPVRQVDWTDHGRPAQHTDPHVHDYVPNPTGGTPQQGPARPPHRGEL